MAKNIFLTLAACMMMTSCTDFDWHQEHETTLTPFAIISGDITTDLTAAGTDMDETTVIEWEKSRTADNTQVFYKVLFSGTGDFSKPDYALEPAHIGTMNSIEVSNRTLNIIAEAAGIPQNGSGSLKWTVMASNGISMQPASSVKEMTITRPEGFAYIPESVILSSSQSLTTMKKLSDGVFELFVTPESGFTIIDMENLSRSYSISGGNLVKDGQTASLATGKIHHVTVDFNKAHASVTTVEEVAVWYNGTSGAISVMTPSSDGSPVWESTFLFQPQGNDLLYKFRFTEKDSSGKTSESFYGYTNAVSRPQNTSSPASYFTLVPDISGAGADYCFSLNRTLHNNKQLSLRVDMRASIDNYTHNVSVR